MTADDEAVLREKARECVLKGKLPSRRPARVWGGPGVGAHCAVCEHAVRRYDLELELQFERGTDVPGLDRFQVHTRCFAAWEFERIKAQPDLALRPDATAAGVTRSPGA